eukprot:IDg16276t1
MAPSSSCDCGQTTACDCAAHTGASLERTHLPGAAINALTIPKKPRKRTSDAARKRAIGDIVAQLIRAQESGEKIQLNKIKKEVSRRHGLHEFPKQVDILSAVPATHRASLAPLLRAKPIRTASGIAVVAVMSKPHRCPHIAVTGNICVYCPGGPDSDFEYSTQSYTGYEPTSMRAIRARYDPYVQTRARVEQLRALGHAVDKVEFIVMGGTFMSLPRAYRDGFISRLHDALSG